jgi:hypothetical protein
MFKRRSGIGYGYPGRWSWVSGWSSAAEALSSGYYLLRALPQARETSPFLKESLDGTSMIIHHKLGSVSFLNLMSTFTGTFSKQYRLESYMVSVTLMSSLSPPFKFSRL